MHLIKWFKTITRISLLGWFGRLKIGVLIFLALLSSACSVASRYNSLDLALLPCESGDSPEFFKAIEFDAVGRLAHPSQLQALRERFDERPVTDLILFVHGWNKNASSAELDYQNFLCRLHGRLRNIPESGKRSGGLLVVGLFWPSTITNRPQEPWLVKPLSYYRVRDRADLIAEVGVKPLLNDFMTSLAPGSVKVHLIGHSFGGRMIVRSLEIMQRNDELGSFLTRVQSLNVVLVNAAVAPSRFDWMSELIRAANKDKRPSEDASVLFNVHSFEDDANHYLFPLASLFNDDETVCAAGACGVPRFQTLCVNASGKIPSTPDSAPQITEPNEQFNAWNVDATHIVSSHTDIYKGRVATLIADLLYDRQTRTTAKFGMLSRNPTKCPE